ncbi:DEAD/DEAH box helicase [bacterium]|nr:DEAD/DEAH box helicase [bacterium]
MITKISNIKFTQPIQLDNDKQQYKYTQYPQYNYVLNNTTNLSLINFTAREFYQTLENNYFQLPSGATPDVFQKASAMNILKDNDVIVTAPTGTGKTAIALYAISKNMNEGVKTFYTTPLKALSNEKFRSFQKIYGEDNVGLLTGDTKVNVNAPIVVMTTEVYRNMVLSDRFNKDNRILDNLKTVIFDELHYLGDADRGGIWEQSIILSDPDTQLLSLSATIGNNKDVANWMADSKGHTRAEIVSGKERNMETYRARENSPVHTVLIDVPSENRHVPLDFEIVECLAEGQSRTNKGNKGKIKKAQTPPKRFPTPSLTSYQNLVRKLKNEDKVPAIFFVFSKRQSNEILNHLSKFGERLNSEEEQSQILDILKKYKEEGKYLGESLNYQALFRGYAIHNAGLLPTQKELIEELFNKKLVKVVIATETLSAGINMPARTTVITSDRTPVGELNANKFHQMAGRAGRRGIDTQGYCITMAVNKKQAENYERLIQSSPDNLESAFRPDFSFVAGYYATCQNDDLINELLEKSFYAYDNNPQIKSKKAQEMKSFFASRRRIMKKMDFIKSNHQLTPKGELLAKLNGYEQIPIIDAIYNRKLEGLNPVELVGAVATMANIEPKFENPHKKDDADCVYYHSNSNLQRFVNSFDADLKKFNVAVKQYDPEYRETQLEQKIATHLYEWAKLNAENDDSVENWKKLYHGDVGKTIKNEGSVFKEITTTADLLKQMKLIAQTGMKNSVDLSEYNYYEHLSYDIDEAISLICRNPVEV